MPFEDDDTKPGSTSDAGADVIKDDDQLVDDTADQPDDDDEELYDKDGKPLPWANSKRFRKIYHEAKAGRELNGVLVESGLDATTLRGALQELSDFRAAYREWQAAKAAGDTTPDDDVEAADLKKREQAIAKRLRDLGFMTKEDFEQQKRADSARANASQVAASGKVHLTGLLKSEGLLTDDMDDDEVDDVMAEWDAKVGRRILKTQADVAAFQRGDKAVITRHFKEVLAKGRKSGRIPTPSTKPSFDKLPTRVSPGATSRARSKPEEEPTSIREAAAQMLKDMNGMRR